MPYEVADNQFRPFFANTGPSRCACLPSEHKMWGVKVPYPVNGYEMASTVKGNLADSDVKTKTPSKGFGSEVPRLATDGMLSFKAGATRQGTVESVGSAANFVAASASRFAEDRTGRKESPEKDPFNQT